MNRALRVALIEDHPVFRLALHELVDSNGDLVVVGEAATADDALAVIAETQPDVAVLDLSLPSESGLTLLPKLLTASPATRVLVLTSYRVVDFAGKAIRAGALGFATKEEEPLEILRAIRTVARGGVFVSSFPVDVPDEGTPESADLAAYRRLTRREREVFMLAVCGLSSDDISRRLEISPKTVETHRASMNRKLRVHNGGQLARFAVRNGMSLGRRT